MNKLIEQKMSRRNCNIFGMSISYNKILATTEKSLM